MFLLRILGVGIIAFGLMPYLGMFVDSETASQFTKTIAYIFSGVEMVVGLGLLLKPSLIYWLDNKLANTKPSLPSREERMWLYRVKMDNYRTYGRYKVPSPLND